MTEREIGSSATGSGPHLVFGILGPVEVSVDGVRVALGGTRHTTLLALLLANAPRPVPVGILIDAIWDDDPPDTAKRQVQNLVSGLRRTFSSAGVSEPVVVADSASYRVRVEAGSLDADRFGDLLAAATRCAEAGDAEREVGLLGEALAQWRGPALLGLTGRMIESAAARLNERRLTAAERRFELALRLDRPHEIVAELTDLVAAHPLRERLVGQLMRALNRSGRQAEAVFAFQRLRRELDDLLGIEVGPAVQQIYTAILAAGDGGTARPAGAGSDPTGGGDPTGGDPTGGGPAGGGDPAGGGGGAGPGSRTGAGPGTVPWPTPAPAQLPPDLGVFAAREAELDRLDAALHAAAGTGQTGTGQNGMGQTGMGQTGTGQSGVRRPATVMIAAITGMAGIGKTALAVHWAHRVRDHFPDGQLFVDLCGHGADRPLTPDQVLTQLLHGLGLPATAVPSDVQTAAGLYRSMLAGRQVLIVLDNAHDLDQVRPLLPGTAGCAVVVTSRCQLTGLATASGADLLPVDVVGPADARTMFVNRVDDDRIGREPVAVRRILTHCGGLPLAVAIAAARAASQPTLPLSALADELADIRTRLDALDAGTPDADLRTVLSWSVRRLEPVHATLFRLLGIHPGPDIDVTAAARLADIPVSRARRVLTDLVRVHLVTQPGAGQYQLADLLRAYSLELAAELDDGFRRAALLRVLDHYLHSAVDVTKVLATARIAHGPGAGVWQPDAVPTVPRQRGAADEIRSGLSEFDAVNPVG